MYFLRVRALILTYIVISCFSCGGTKLPVAEENYLHNLPVRKAYVVIRSEGGTTNVQRVKDILSSDFLENNVSTNFSLYRAKQAWNQNDIFNSAYKGQYDYIVLIDQVAKFTIDNRTQVGGKYQIRSYHIKSPNPNWLDLGQATCNLSVVPSVQKFSREIIRSIVGNKAAFKNHDFEYDDSLASNDDKNIINENKSSKNLASEVELLRKELEQEKRRTRLAEDERNKLESQLRLEVETQKQRAKIAEIEAEDAALKIRQRQREIAEAYEAKNKEIKKREDKAALENPPIVESKPKELTREERLSRRQETKRRIAEEKKTKRLEAAKTLAAKKEERAQLEKFEKEERRRLKEELEAQRKEKSRLAEEDLKRIKEKVAAERRQAEALAKQKKEAEKLAEAEQTIARQKAKELEAQQKEQTRIEKEKAEVLEKQERIARRMAREEDAKRKEIQLKAQRLEEKREAQIKLTDLENQAKERQESEPVVTNSKKKVLKSINTSSKLISVYVILRGKQDDKKQLEDLEDYIEFNFMFIKTKVESIILSPDESISLANISTDIFDEHNVIILVDQKEYLGNGKSTYQIMSVKTKTDRNWKNVLSEGYNLDIKADLKQLSKKIAEHLKN